MLVCVASAATVINIHTARKHFERLEAAASVSDES